MRLVISDTGPVNYLILIGQIDLLHKLFESVILPEAVFHELVDPDAPHEVRMWIANLPKWIEVHKTAYFPTMSPVGGIHEGEKAAIALALDLKADLLLMDDRKGVKEAEGKGLIVTGTLGVLDRAAELGMVDFGEAIKKLERSSFRRPEALLNSLLKKHRQPSLRP